MKILKEYTALVVIIIIFLIAVLFNLQNNKVNFNFTAREEKYIQNNPVILLGPDPDFAPVEFYEDGQFKGIVPDLVKYINEHTDLTIKMIKYKTWDDVIKGIKNDEIDMLGAVSKSENRATFLEFSESYLSIPNVFVTKKNSIYDINDDFSNITIAAVRNSAKHDLLIENYPKAQIVPVKNIQTGLERVAMGTVDAYLGSLSQMTYYIDEYKFSNLEINQRLDRSLEYSYAMHFAVQKDNEILQSIINKILLNMPKDIKDNIIKQWMGFNSSDFFINKGTVAKALLVFSVIVLIFLMVIHFLRHELDKGTREIKTLNEKLVAELNRSKKMTNDISLSLISVIEIYDNYTKGHSKNVADYSKLIAKALDFDEHKLEECYYSALLHDLGKTIIPNDIVCKKGKLSTSEYEIIKKHSYYSYKILKNIEAFGSMANNVLYHHERYDGLGYPDGLKGEAIPLISRIICIADAFDAMTTSRSYRHKITIEEATKELKACAGTQFDPHLADVFLEVINDKEIFDLESSTG